MEQQQSAQQQQLREARLRELEPAMPQLLKQQEDAWAQVRQQQQVVQGLGTANNESAQAARKQLQTMTSSFKQLQSQHLQTYEELVLGVLATEAQQKATQQQQMELQGDWLKVFMSVLAQWMNASLGTNRELRLKATENLSSHRNSILLNVYLAQIFRSPYESVPAGIYMESSEYFAVRFSAGTTLKNNLRSNYRDISSIHQIIVEAAVVNMKDKALQVRSISGNITTEILRRGGLAHGKELIEALLRMAEEPSSKADDPATVESKTNSRNGAADALNKICEDNTKLLERDHSGERYINTLLPRLIEITTAPDLSPKARASILQAINVFTPRKSQAMLNSIDGLLQRLFHLATVESTDVRRQICRAFVSLVEMRPDKLQPHLNDLVDYILMQQRSDDEELQREAAEFWLAVGEHEDFWRSLEPHISKIIPVLLECMVYSSDDIALLGDQSDDEDEEDREEDLKPQFAKKNLSRNQAAAASQNGANNYEKANMMDDDDKEEGEIDDEEADDEDGDESPDERWTVRKCSAAALDVFASDFGNTVFEHLLPYLTQNIKHDDWPHREAAVLALGAIAEGCITAVEPHLPELVPYLITLLNDSEPVVRQITCWALGRYSGWAAGLTDPAQIQSYFVPMMEGLLVRMLDKNKKVQKAGGSAMANLEEKAGKKLELYVGPIVQQFVLCFAKYKDSSLYVLYDCIQTLAEHLGPVLARPDLVNQLMPALIDRWQKTADESREIFPLFECFSYVCVALGPALVPFAQPIWKRCVDIMHQNLEASMRASTDPTQDQPDKDFLVTSLDLQSSVIQALGPEIAPELVAQTSPAGFELLCLCLGDPTDEVRQSAYALVGDSARFVFPHLQPHLEKIMTSLLAQLEPDDLLDEEADSGFSVINNACWSAGEIAMQAGAGISKHIELLLVRLVKILKDENIPPAVTENAAIAVGRLGLQTPELIAPHLKEFAMDFLQCMDDVDATEEKATAFKGFTQAVLQNPEVMEPILLYYFKAIASYQDLQLRKPVSVDLHKAFQEVLDLYRRLMPTFSEFIAQLNPNELAALRANYTL